jgi:hypothetical protein
VLHPGLLAGNRKSLARRAAGNKIDRFDIGGVYFPYVAVDRNTGKTMGEDLPCVFVNLAHPRNLMAELRPRQLKPANTRKQSA